MAWYNGSWTYRVQVTIDHTKVDSDLTDFPVYVDLSDLPAGFFTNVLSSGADIRVTRSDGTTECPFELVFITTGSSIGELHFKANFISSTSDTSFYIYYGNGSASAYSSTDTYGRNNVWTNGFVYVNHMQSNTAADSTGNGGAATASGSPSAVAGKLAGNSIEFGGTNHMEHTSFSELGGMSIFGFSCWMNADSVSGGRQFLSKASSSNTNRCFWVQIHPTLGFIALLSSDGTSSNRGYYSENGATSLPTGSWTHIYSHIDFSTDAVVLHFDDVSQSTTNVENGTGFPSSTRSTSESFWIGERNDSKLGFDGELDEIRLFDAARSTGWISAEYDNQDSPSTFYTIGSQETDSGGGGGSSFLPSVIFM